jgi:hypothetical protein
MKPHQINSLFFLGGLIIGSVLQYTLYSKTVSLKVDEAYETGVQFGKEGKDEECKDFLKQFNEADSVYIGSNEIKFYYK